MWNRVLNRNLETELNLLQGIRTKIEDELLGLPNGHLRISSCRNTIRYFYVDRTDPNLPAHGKYIRRDSEDLVDLLSQKEYDEKIYPIVCKRIKAIETLLGKCDFEVLEGTYSSLHPARKEHVDPWIQPDDLFVENWEAMSTPVPYDEDARGNFETKKGDYVRHRTEKMIADMLYEEGIPYRYRNPGFVVLDVPNRREVLWIHLGPMDNPMNCTRALNRLENFESKGYVLGDDLLMTYETREHPLTAEIVKRNIERVS